MWGRGRNRANLVWYLRGAGAIAIEAWEATIAFTEPTAGLPWVAAGAAAAGGGGTVAVAVAAVVGKRVAAAAAAAVGPGWDSPAGGGEERCTRGLKLCPPRVFTMAGLEKEMR